MEKLLADTRIGLRTNSLPLQAFWNSFAVYAPCSLLSAASGKSIFDITKNKELREQLQTLLKEIVSITPRVLPPFDADELLKRIFNIPSSYNFRSPNKYACTKPEISISSVRSFRKPLFKTNALFR